MTPVKMRKGGAGAFRLGKRLPAGARKTHTRRGMMNVGAIPAGLPSRVCATGGAAVRGGARANALTLAAALAMPVLVHMAPWGGATPLGALLLPMFWAAFVAVYLCGLWAGLLVAAFGPTLNTFLTKFPELRLNGIMSFELAVFVVFSWVVLRGEKGRGFWLLAPLAFVVAKLGSSAVRAAGAEAAGGLELAAEFFMRSVTNGAPGLAILAAINFALVRGWIGNCGGGDGGGQGPEAAA